MNRLLDQRPLFRLRRHARQSRGTAAVERAQLGHFGQQADGGFFSDAGCLVQRLDFAGQPVIGLK